MRLVNGRIRFRSGADRTVVIFANRQPSRNAVAISNQLESLGMRIISIGIGSNLQITDIEGIRELASEDGQSYIITTAAGVGDVAVNILQITGSGELALCCVYIYIYMFCRFLKVSH